MSTNPGTETVREKSVGTTSMVPSAICHMPSSGRTRRRDSEAARAIITAAQRAAATVTRIEVLAFIV